MSKIPVEAHYHLLTLETQLFTDDLSRYIEEFQIICIQDMF